MRGSPGSKVSELDLPNALYKDFKAQSQIALEKFILLKMKECFKENKALKA